MAQRLLNHSTLGSRVIKKKKKDSLRSAGPASTERRLWNARGGPILRVAITCVYRGTSLIKDTP